MNRLAQEASLWVAALQLIEVRSVTAAIRAADAAGRQQKANAIASPAIEPRRHLHPGAVYEPRKHERASAVYHARPGCCHPAPHARHWDRPACDIDPKVVPAAHTPEHRIQPPWAVLSWPQPLPPRHPVKSYAECSDVTGKGATLDIFL